MDMKGLAARCFSRMKLKVERVSCSWAKRVYNSFHIPRVMWLERRVHYYSLSQDERHRAAQARDCGEDNFLHRQVLTAESEQRPECENEQQAHLHVCKNVTVLIEGCDLPAYQMTPDITHPIRFLERSVRPGPR